MPYDPTLRAHQEWLGYIQPVGLVVSPAALVAAGCVHFPSFTREFLGWQESDLAGAPGGPPLSESPSVALASLPRLEPVGLDYLWPVSG